MDREIRVAGKVVWIELPFEARVVGKLPFRIWVVGVVGREDGAGTLKLREGYTGPSQLDSGVRRIRPLQLKLVADREAV